MSGLASQSQTRGMVLLHALPSTAVVRSGLLVAYPVVLATSMLGSVMLGLLANGAWSAYDGSIPPMRCRRGGAASARDSSLKGVV